MRSIPIQSAILLNILFDHLIGVQFKDQQRAYISIQLAEIEHALNKGSSEKAQLVLWLGYFRFVEQCSF